MVCYLGGEEDGAPGSFRSLFLEVENLFVGRWKLRFVRSYRCVARGKRVVGNYTENENGYFDVFVFV